MGQVGTLYGIYFVMLMDDIILEELFLHTTKTKFHISILDMEGNIFRELCGILTAFTTLSLTVVRELKPHTVMGKFVGSVKYSYHHNKKP